MYYNKYETKIGDIYISANEDNILSISYQKESNFIKKETSLIAKAITQINEYLNKERTTFDLPILISGTPFQKAIYKKLINVDYGKVITYKELGKLIEKENASRAVGGACNKNPYSIVVPCHRVVASSYDLTGYAGGLHIKIDLLELEGIKIKNKKVIINE